MTKRSFTGEPFDMTYQHFAERPRKESGETVGGTTADDVGSETTTVGGRSDLEREIRAYAITNPDAGPTEVAEEVGCHKSYAWRVLNRIGDEEYYGAESLADLSDTAASIVWLQAGNPEWTQRRIAHHVSVTESYVSQVLTNNEPLVEEARRQIEEWSP